MIKQLLLVAALSPVAAASAVATPLGLNAGAYNNSTNQQTNEGTVIQSPSGGSQTNINQNNAFSSTYSFGPGISCPTPSIAATAFNGRADAWSGGYDSGANNYGGALSFILPIGGSIGETCKSLVKEIARQRFLDTQVTMINTCAQFAQQNVSIDTTKFPEFKVCSAVMVEGTTAVNITDGFKEESNVQTVIPIR